ncbi:MULTISPECIES: Rne/Rng family ribonuclease [Pacificibacter]|uniref:Rne/Rng family ribonuclease n=1 Tax=Pacificibacter TaxID=1042323 RepID=UPI001C094C11|nr:MULTISPECIES: Rne/Rng family ribonuclease [Pacificibacter]MBU2935590.1 Rne/Rng family ribonuclease [Pacificibacter marinus]MDO6614086.1 Rne/Rng family ribonuclease [Pacificibacter sp. 1_MG-2023]
MAKKMLIDATHAEETRVVVVDGNKVEEFDFESENKRQIAGNIYLAKVTRVEPSLQAAFVDYGGNRHGFLAFSEIHPDYYQIPVADREALMAEELAHAKAQEEEDEKPTRTRRRSRSRSRSKAEETVSDDAVATAEVASAEGEADATAESETDATAAVETTTASGMDVVEPDLSAEDALIADASPDSSYGVVEEGTSPAFTVQDTPVEEPVDAASDEAQSDDVTSNDVMPKDDTETVAATDAEGADDDSANDDDDDDEAETASDKDSSIENVADDDTHEDIRPRRKARARRYKIQEVIKVRQILLIQVVKEERGNKGAALTTYLSLAGRYCVLMPNTARGGGISRKITNAADRKKLKEIATEMDVPQGAGLIVRTAGAQRTKTEIKRDYDYLKRMWEQIRELTLKSVAPAQIYEEGDLIKRSIRDLYSKEIDEVIVEGDAGFRTAKDFMRMIMPTHAKNVTNYRENLPLFARYQVESYLGSMFNPTVQLKSGGYIVIEVTEALVSVDVNSGRSTKEGSIEDTALKTNLEAAEELARQARLRDLAGLIVIDFIDMEERRNNASVEKRLKDKLKTDRARIQVGRISGFGLLEMSRQRLRPGMLEATTQPCHICHGTGLIRSDDNMALTILRQLEEEGTRRRSKEVLLKAPVAIINYLMNMKRENIAQIEARYGMAVRLEADPHMISPDFTIEKFKTATRVVHEVAHTAISASAALMDEIDDDVVEAEEIEETQEEAVVATPAAEGEEDQPKKRRRRRRRRRKSSDQVEGQTEGEEGGEAEATSTEAESKDVATSDAAPVEGEAASDETSEDKPKRTRTRRSRGGRNRSSGNTETTEVSEAVEGEAQAAEPVVSEASGATADAAIEGEAPAEKLNRTRTRRKKADPVAEVAVAEAASAETPTVPVEAAAETSEEAPAPKPKRTRRKKAEPAAETVVAAEAVATQDAAAKPKPKRKRRTKAEIEADKAAKAAAAEAAAAPTVEAAVDTTPAPVEVEPAPVTTSPEPVVAEAAPVVEQPAPEPVAAPEVVEAAVETAPAEPAKPKRKGWWSIG